MFKKLFLPIVLAVSFNTALAASEVFKIAGAWAAGTFAYYALFHNQLIVRKAPYWIGHYIGASPTKEAILMSIRDVKPGLFAALVVTTAARALPAHKLSLDDVSPYLVKSIAFTGLGVVASYCLTDWKAAMVGGYSDKNAWDIFCANANLGARIAGAVGVLGTAGFIVRQRMNS